MSPDERARQLDDSVPSVLFLCVHNAGRSQMALGWFNHLAAGRAVARSGGSEPAAEVNPSAAEAMREVGIDIATESPKRWTDESVRAADVVVTMGCGDACPIFPGRRYEDWALDDPAGRDLAAVRPIRDEIGRRVRDLLARLQVPRRVTGSVAESIVARAAVHAALGEPVRLAIVEDLATSDRAPTDLASRHGLPGNLLAHHLDVLERVELIERHASTGDRRRRYVRLRHDALPALTRGRRPRRGRALFICTHNSARSQLAAALWRARTGDPADSAGTHPAGRVHPGAVAAARRAGIDIGASRPRALRPADTQVDVVVTVCDRAHEELDAAPDWLHWSIPDPGQAGRAPAFDRALAELDRRIAAISAGRPDGRGAGR